MIGLKLFIFEIVEFLKACLSKLKRQKPIARNAPHTGFPYKYCFAFEEALKNQDKQRASEVVLEAFAIPDTKELELAVLADSIAAHRIEPLFIFIQDFVERFDASLYPIKVVWAHILNERRQFDMASGYAREYLRLVKDTGVLDDPRRSSRVTHGIAVAFMILAISYCLAGARSYSLRLIKQALKLRTPETDPSQFPWDRLAKEEKMLLKELKDPAFKATDDKWESFFKNGSHASELMALCEKFQLSLLMKRVDILETHFRCMPDFKIGPEEIYQLLYHFEKTDANGQKQLQQSLR